MLSPHPANYRQDPENVRYIQRCKFEALVQIPEDFTGPKYRLTLDYMGAAEYEFGAFEESRDRFRVAPYVELQSKMIRGKTFHVAFPSHDLRDGAFVDQAIQLLDEKKLRLKCSSHFESFFIGRTTQQLKKGCKKKMETVRNSSYCECWWDISNDWVMWADFPGYTETMVKLFNGLNHGKTTKFLDKVRSLFNR